MSTKFRFGSLLHEYSQALFHAVILAILIRGFFYEPFKIPSSSMVPTLMVGDHIFVKRYAYGLRVPFTYKWIVEWSDPKRGEVVVFNNPNTGEDYIKRVVGIPGDHIRLEGTSIYVNEELIQVDSFQPMGASPEDACVAELDPAASPLLPPEFEHFPVYTSMDSYQPYVETFSDGGKHIIQHLKPDSLDMRLGTNSAERLSYDAVNHTEFVVKDRHYFVMGDNRDDSLDSRYIGQIPRENFKGRAMYIWLSLYPKIDGAPHCPGNPLPFVNVRWNRFGRSIL